MLCWTLVFMTGTLTMSVIVGLEAHRKLAGADAAIGYQSHRINNLDNRLKKLESPQP